MADDIIQFAPGGKVTAEETNENNLLLKEWALDNSQSEAYIDGKIATLTSNLNQQISSINNQISSVNANAVKTSGNQTVNGAKYFESIIQEKVPLTLKYISNSQKGCLWIGQGTKFQWMKVTQTVNSKAHTWKKPFTGDATYVTVVTQINASGGSDVNVAVSKQEQSQVTIYAQESEREKGLYVIGIGY